MAKNRRRSKPIDTEQELLRELGVSKLPEVVKDAAAEARLVQLAPDLAPELVAHVLTSVPELSKAFNKLIGALETIGHSLEETKRLRWQILRDLAKDEKLSAEQILEAMRIIADIEKRETIDYTAVFKRIAEVLGVAIAVVVGGLLIVFGLGRTRDGGSGQA